MVNWRVDRDSGLLIGARWVPSPNQDERPAGQGVDAIVIHAISLPPGEFGGADVESFFTNQLAPDAHPFFDEILALKVSSHLFVRRDGSVIQFVPFFNRAWHAGLSALGGRERVNDFSIGIEMEGSDYSPFEEAQYQSLATIAEALVAVYPGITADRIVGHSEISPGRKTDPGPYFNWNRFRGRHR